MKDPHTFTLKVQKGVEKHILYQDSQRKIFIKFDSIIIFSFILSQNKTYSSMSWVQNDGKTWLVDFKDKFFEWIDVPSQLYASENVLIIIIDIISLRSQTKSILVQYSKE